MADAYYEASLALKQIIDAEFVGEAWAADQDKLHESMGWDGRVAGISPIRQGKNSRNANVKETYILVQLYDIWDKEISPNTQVNPTAISGFADRFERALETYQQSSVKTNAVWYFEVDSLEYPDDPTGNKSRFHATIKVTGDNSALTQR